MTQLALLVLLAHSLFWTRASCWSRIRIRLVVSVVCAARGVGVEDEPEWQSVLVGFVIRHDPVPGPAIPGHDSSLLPSKAETPVQVLAHGYSMAENSGRQCSLRTSACLCAGAAGSDLWSGSSLGVGSASRLAAGAGLSQGKLLDAAAAAAGAAGLGDALNGGTGMFTEMLPAGCAPDAYKLFVGNVPKSFTEEELRPVSGSAGLADGVLCLLTFAATWVERATIRRLYRGIFPNTGMHARMIDP